MRPTERLLMWGAMVLCLGLALGGAGIRASNATAAPAVLVDPAKIATCDIYQLVERLAESDKYKPAQEAEIRRGQAELAPLEKELDALDKDIQGSDQQAERTKANIRTFETKRTDYLNKRGKAESAYSELVVGQFAEAYQAVAAEARRVAESRGFGYVIAQKSGEISAREPRLLVEEFLARPVAIAPEGTDITEAVRTAMKLPAMAPNASPASAAPKDGANGK